jgi:DNA polymerase III delta prime subunit
LIHESNNQNLIILQNMINDGSLPHLLFHGTSGTGKTSTIIALAKQLYKNNINLMVMKLDASDDRGINSVREEIKGFAEKKNIEFNKEVKNYKTGFYSMNINIDYNKLIERLQEAKNTSQIL